MTDVESRGELSAPSGPRLADYEYVNEPLAKPIEFELTTVCASQGYASLGVSAQDFQVIGASAEKAGGSAGR